MVHAGQPSAACDRASSADAHVHAHVYVHVIHMRADASTGLFACPYGTHTHVNTRFRVNVDRMYMNMSTHICMLVILTYLSACLYTFPCTCILSQVCYMSTPISWGINDEHARAQVWDLLLARWGWRCRRLESCTVHGPRDSACVGCRPCVDISMYRRRCGHAATATTHTTLAALSRHRRCCFFFRIPRFFFFYACGIFSPSSTKALPSKTYAMRPRSRARLEQKQRIQHGRVRRLQPGGGAPH